MSKTSVGFFSFIAGASVAAFASAFLSSKKGKQILANQVQNWRQRSKMTVDTGFELNDDVAEPPLKKVE